MSDERRMTVIEVTADEDAKLADIKRRWTDQSALVREGFPTGVLAHGHVVFLLDLIERHGKPIPTPDVHEPLLPSITAKPRDTTSFIYPDDGTEFRGPRHPLDMD